MEKKIQRLNKIFSIGVIVLLFVLAILIVAGKEIYKFTGNDLGKAKGLVTDTVSINWIERYPFSSTNSVADVTTSAESNQLDVKPEGKLSKLWNLYTGVMQKAGSVGEQWEQYMIRYSDIARLGYIFNACISDPGTGGNYVRLNNGYWTDIWPAEDSKTVEEKVDAIQDLKNYISNQDISFVYVQTPMKICQYDKELPANVEDYTNENLDRLLEGLANENIDCLDMRKNLHEDFDDHYDLFYKTDHHWNIDAGLWACDIIEQHINNQYDIKIDREFNDPTLYSRTVYENALFGSAGQAITHFVEDSEDFSILFPEFKTDFRLVIPDKDIDSTGSFNDLFVDYDMLNDAINDGGGYAYETLLYGNRPLVQITNNNNKIGPKVLMIRDSFSLAVAPYMALGCSELDLIDIRPSNGNFTGSVRTYIDEMKPDIVIMLVNTPSTLYK